MDMEHGTWDMDMDMDMGMVVVVVVVRGSMFATPGAPRTRYNPPLPHVQHHPFPSPSPSPLPPPSLAPPPPLSPPSPSPSPSPKPKPKPSPHRSQAHPARDTLEKAARLMFDISTSVNEQMGSGMSSLAPLLERLTPYRDLVALLPAAQARRLL
jgi:hypothetical protein